MPKRLPLGRIAIGRRDELAAGRFVLVELNDATNARLTGSPGCQHLFEVSEPEVEETYEVVEDIDIIA